MAVNCVIYRRYSSDEQGSGQGDTLVTQLEACEAYARRKGWDVVDVLTDDGFSAYKGEHLRPGAQLYDFVERVNAGAVEEGTVLLAYKPNRLSRLPVDQTMVWIHGLTSRGLGIAFADKDTVFAAKPTFEQYFGMALPFAVANRESEDKSENSHRARAKMWDKAERREGRWTNLASRAPLWLSRNMECNDWIKDDHRVQIVNLIYRWSADGLGAVTIANRLNAMGEEPWGLWRKRPGWGRTAIRQLLVNPAVEGDFVPESGPLLGRRLHSFYPQIVEADLVARARANQKARRREAGKRASTGTANLFAGITFCGECGAPAFLTSHRKKGRTYSYLRCEAAGEGRSKGKAAEPCQNKVYYPYAAFELAALDLCLDLALDDRFFEATGQLRLARNHRAELEKQIAERRAKRKQIMRNFREDDEDAKDLLGELAVEVDALSLRLTQAEAQIESATGKVGAVEHLRRVNDIRAAAVSEDPLVREQARSKLRQAFTAILAGVDIERTAEGEKIFTVSFLGGLLGVRINTEGVVVARVSEALGKPLHEFLTPEQRKVAEPLIRRMAPQNG